jgi:hypothetical protein
MRRIKETIRIKYECFLDLTKILKVKYIRSKENTLAAKTALLKKIRPAKEVKELIVDMRYYDENRNQILVNL